MGLATIGILCQFHSEAQQGKVKTDSLKEWLCKTWEIDYVLAEGMKITGKSGTSDIIYEFKPDGTFIFNPSAENSEKGSWVYDPEKKLIRLLTNSNKNSRVVSILPNEMVMLINRNRKAAGNGDEMQMVFKVHGE